MADDYDDEAGVDENGARAAATANGGHGATTAALSTQLGPGPGLGQGGEIMFTTSQVRSIVASAVAEKEASLCAHYDMILAERLQGESARRPVPASSSLGADAPPPRPVLTPHRPDHHTQRHRRPCFRKQLGNDPRSRTPHPLFADPPHPTLADRPHPSVSIRPASTRAIQPLHEVQRRPHPPEAVAITAHVHVVTLPAFPSVLYYKAA